LNKLFSPASQTPVWEAPQKKGGKFFPPFILNS